MSAPSTRMRTSVPRLSRSSVPAMRAFLRFAVVVGVVSGVVIPIAVLVIQSIGDRWFYPDLLPRRLSDRAWAYVVSGRTGVLGATAMSLGIAVAVTAISILLGVPAGRGLAALTQRSRRAWEWFFLLPVVIPPLAVALGLHVAFLRVGLTDTAVGVIIAHLLPTVPYMVLVTMGTFLNIDLDHEAQARTLGAGPVRAFLVVGVPSAMPGLATGSLFVFLISWSQYALTVLIGGGRVVTLPILLFAFASSGDMSVAAALSLVFVLPPVLVLFLTARLVSASGVLPGGVMPG